MSLRSGTITTTFSSKIYLNGTVASVNAASARIKGVDVEVLARPLRALTLSFNLNYLDGQYTSYPLAPDCDAQPNGSIIAVGARDAAGRRIVQAPRLGLLAAATYTLDTPIGTFGSTANVSYQSRFFNDPQNDFPVPGRTLIDLNEQWTANDEMTRLSIWVRNLTNKAWNTSIANRDAGGPAGPARGATDVRDHSGSEVLTGRAASDRTMAGRQPHA